jgi:hypothetical protein
MTEMKFTPTSLSILALIAAAVSMGCSKDHETARDAAAAQTPAVPERRFETSAIPGGTILVASLDNRISTASSQSGEPFTATTIEAVMVDGRVAIPAGARIHGALRDVKAAGRIKGRAHLTLAYDTIVDAEGNTETLTALPLTLQAASGTRGDVEKIAGGGVLGAIVGGIAGGGKGAAIGAGAGAGAGTVLTLAHKGDDVVLAAGQRLDVHTTSATTIQVLAQR